MHRCVHGHIWKPSALPGDSRSLAVPGILVRLRFEFGSFALAPTHTPPLSPRSPPAAADAGCSTNGLEAFASSTRDIPVGSSLFSVELRPEPAAEKKAVNDRLIPSPSPRPLPKGEGEPLGSSGRVECAKAFGRAGDGRAAVAPSFGAWDRSRHSPNLDEVFGCSPSPRGRGRGEGEGFVRFSIASFTLQVALIPPKIAKNRLFLRPGVCVCAQYHSEIYTVTTKGLL